jgi:AcrR family transcriptional regulator
LLPAAAPAPLPSPIAAPAADAAGETRERLLDVAEELFAERGFRGASVREITRLAACNLAAINYHFGGKAGLYREVILRRLAALRRRRIDSIGRTLADAGEGATLELLLRAFTAAFVEPLVSEPGGRTWLKLVSWEMVDPRLPRQTFFDEMIMPVQESLIAALMRLCPGLSRRDADLCAHSLVGQLVHVVLFHRSVSDAAAPGVKERYPLPELVAHVVRFAAAGIRTLTAESAPGVRSERLPAPGEARP